MLVAKGWGGGGRRIVYSRLPSLLGPAREQASAPDPARASSCGRTHSASTPVHGRSPAIA
eukprot:5930567-Pleurochrysis_carterae.AAC.1